MRWGVPVDKNQCSVIEREMEQNAGTRKEENYWKNRWMPQWLHSEDDDSGKGLWDFIPLRLSGKLLITEL